MDTAECEITHKLRAAVKRPTVNKHIADDYGFRVVFLPSYSPDLNKPIENKWANTKRRLRLHMREYSGFWDCLIHAFK